MVALAAAEAAANGIDVAGVVAAAESTRARLSVFGAIDTLENLRKGGRIGGAAAALGTLLSIKPVIEVRDGVVEQESRQRTRAKSLRYLADKVHAAGPLERLAVIGADAPDLDQFVALIDDVKVRYPRLTGEIGPVIGTHAGPGAIGVVWVTALGTP
jgi:DegV family protein with EDD domain